MLNPLQCWYYLKLLSVYKPLRYILKIYILTQTLSYAIYTVLKPPHISSSERNSLILLSDE